MLSTNSTSPFLSFSSGELLSGEAVVGRRRKRSQNKLDATAVRQIRAQGAGTSNPNIEQLGKKYGVSVSTIKAVLNRKTWKEVK
jgi:DNA invertase Pin-like site-specific DNA recombinase